MKQDERCSTEITDGVRLSTDFTKSDFGTPKPCVVIMFGGDDPSDAEVSARLTEVVS